MVQYPMAIFDASLMLAVDPDTLPPPDIRGTLREAACGHVH